MDALMENEKMGGVEERKRKYYQKKCGGLTHLHGAWEGVSGDGKGGVSGCGGGGGGGEARGVG
jgi:hypothetical protein